MPTERPRRRIPEATVARLPVYLRILSEQAEEEVESISSDRLAELAGVNAAKVRKDLSYLGSYGTRGVGYEVAYLVYQIRRELGLTHDWPVVIVGAGNLGQALAGYGGFGERGFPVGRHRRRRPRQGRERCSVGCVFATSTNCPRSCSPSGSTSASSPRRPPPPRTPPSASSRAGVTSILNFAPVVLSVPRSIEVRKVDLAVELQILSYHEQRRATTSTLRSVSGGVGGVPGTGGASGIGGTAATTRPASA